METIHYIPTGVCSRAMEIDVENGIIAQVRIEGGCNGNLQGLSVLLQGMSVDAAIEKLEGINCKGRGTSCPDQISLALRTLGK